MFQTILVGLKFNQAGQRALETAAQLAHRLGAGVSVVHALDYHLQGEALRDACDSAHLEFKALSENIRTAPEPLTLACEPGEPAMVVCRTARKLGAGLIVLGCHQEGQCLSRMDYTSMTVVEKAACPVLIVPMEASADGDFKPYDELGAASAGPMPEQVP